MTSHRGRNSMILSTIPSVHSPAVVIPSAAPRNARVPAPTKPADELSLPEMLRVMDLARVLREERASLEREFNVTEARTLLREKLLASTEITGEQLTPEEVDQAIEQYFASLHTYRDPPLSFEVFLAHLYVRRWMLTWTLLGLVFLGTALWRTVPTMTPAARQTRVQQRTSANLDRLLTLADSEAIAPDARTAVEQLQREAAAARATHDSAKLQQIESQVVALRRDLNEEYEVHIVSDRKRKSGIDHYFNNPETREDEREPSWYAIVEAHNSRGQLLTRSIANSETKRTSPVTTWGERIPQEVFERLKADKRDGVLNETLFAIKRRGYLQEEVKLTGADGKPLPRTGQITAW